MYQPTIGDRVVIKDVRVGSRDVIGLAGTVRSVRAPDEIVVDPRPDLKADVVATEVAPA